MHIETLNLREVIVFLAAAGVVVPLVHRLRVSPVLGFLAVGLIIGPHGLARFAETLPWLDHIVIADLDGVRALAELGVVFLLFMIGLELSLDRLWAMRRLVFGLGAVQVIASAAAIAGIAAGFGNSPAVATVLGAGFALSSTAIVMQLLAENRRLGSPAGQLGFAILLFQDLAVLPILFLIAALSAQGEGPVMLTFAAAMGQALAAVAVILAVGRLLIRPLFRVIGSTASREMFLALVLLVIIGTATVTSAVGLSMALGAFLAGLLLAETEYRHEIGLDIEPFKGLLLGLFFVSIGMSIDLAEIGHRPLWLFGSVAGLFLVKGAIIYLLTRLSGQPNSVAVELGLLLGQGGEFAFVVIGLGTALGLIADSVAQFMLIVAGTTMAVTAPLAQVARHLARRIEAWEARRGLPEAAAPAGLTGHVIVVGYGRVGQLLGSVLEAQAVPHLALDLDADVVARFRAGGSGVYYGDASRAELLQRFGVDRATALVATMDNPHAAERIVASARRRWPELPIFARARDVGHANRLFDRGASHVVLETTEASLQLGEMVLSGAGVPAQAARQVVEARRQLERSAVDAGRQRQAG